MIKWLCFVGVAVWLLEPAQKSDSVPVTNFHAEDSISVDVLALYDSAGLLDGYKAEVFTPICEKDKCYAVTVDFYWDLMGRFVRYDTLPGEALTKLDHIPFEEEDYLTLHRILREAQSPLARYEKEELVRDTRMSEVDGLTGATISEIKNSVISGAVYSCYVLWHIANGPAVDSIRGVTIDRFDKRLVEKLVASEDQDINYFLINSFSQQDFERFLPQVLRTIQTGQGYYAKNAIDQMPKSLLADSATQEFFGSEFQDLNYYAQIALLKKLQAPLLSDKLILALEGSRSDRGSYRNELITSLIGGADDH